MTPVLVFDIETVPDVIGLRRVHDVPAELSDEALCAWLTQRRRAQSGSEILPLQFQRVVAIACALRDSSGLRVWSLGETNDPELELIRRFSTASTAIPRSSCPGTAVASICRCC